MITSHAHGQVLAEVRYELFESDVESVQENPHAHEIDREICLVYGNGARLYLSWANAPVMYCVGIQDASFFSNAPEAIVDMSESKLWKDLIGGTLVLEYLDNDHQVLMLKGARGTVFVSSQSDGHWVADVITISGERPL
jgi:hypothetical protein